MGDRNHPTIQLSKCRSVITLLNCDNALATEAPELKLPVGAAMVAPGTMAGPAGTVPGVTVLGGPGGDTTMGRPLRETLMLVPCCSLTHFLPVFSSVHL